MDDFRSIKSPLLPQLSISINHQSSSQVNQVNQVLTKIKLRIRPKATESNILIFWKND